VTGAHTYLLDTNIISHVMRDPTGRVAQRIFGREEHEGSSGVCTSLVVQCELLFGLHKLPNPKWERQYRRAIASITVEPLGQEVVAHYATVRAYLEAQGQPIGPNDTLIAAHALSLGATLVSADAAFNRVPGLSVENWLNPVSTK
jgi:tRNA(fMet)-specific endonuclease VapC